MLRSFRQVFQSNRMPVAAIFLLVLVSMVIYLVPSGRMDTPETVVARVYGHDILLRDLLERESELSQRFGSQASGDAMRPFIQSQALRDLMDQKLMEELAVRHHVVVTDEEVAVRMRAFLRQYPILLDDKGNLKPTAELEKIFQETGFNPTLQERALRSDLIRAKLIQQAALVVPVDAAWLDLENQVRNGKVGFDQVLLPVDTAAIADPGDGPLEALYQASGDRFLQGPRRVIQVAVVDRASLGSALNVDDAALQAAYAAHKNDYVELKARHILFKATTDAEAKAATEKALALRAKLVKGEDFGKAAEALSEDPTAKGNGGELGWFHFAQMVKPFSEAAAALKVGEISQPVRTQYGIHLIQLEGRKDKTFDEVKDQLRSSIQDERFAARAQERLDQVRKRANGGDLAAAARSAGCQVILSQPFTNSPDAASAGLPELPQLAGEAFSLKVGETSKPEKAGDRYVLFRVQAELPEAVPPFKDIRAQVLAAWKLEEARKQTLAKAVATLKGGDLKALGGTFTTQAPGPISALKDLGALPAVRKALLDTPVGQVTAPAWSADGQLWAAKITSREAPPALTFDTRRTLIQQIQGDEARKLLSAELQFLDRQGRERGGLRSFYGQFGGIYVNTDALKALLQR
jgi:peptidyl-prolyl cis-trans isomerase D